MNSTQGRSAAMYKLNVKQVQHFKGPGRLGDGGNLFLCAKRTGVKSWMFIFKSPATGRKREMGLGSAGVFGVSLAEARAMAEDLRRQLRAGVDCIDAREADRASAREETAKLEVPTFLEFALEYIETHRAGWKNAKHRAQWETTIKTHAASLHSMRLDEIDTPHVLAVLKPIWSRIPETAWRLKGRIFDILEAAKAAKHRDGSNPAAWADLKHLLGPRKRLTRGHQRSLAYATIPAFMAALRAQDTIGARALEFLVLTAARPNEAAGCMWTEIDEANRVWNVPHERMKEGRAHRQPLSPRALAIVKEMRAIREPGAKFVFPGRKGALDIAALTNTLKRLGFHGDTCTHGMRATFRTWAGEETNFARDVCEVALSHKVEGDTEGAYQRGDKLEKRRALLNAWEAYCLSNAESTGLALAAA